MSTAAPPSEPFADVATVAIVANVADAVPVLAAVLIALLLAAAICDHLAPRRRADCSAHLESDRSRSPFRRRTHQLRSAGSRVLRRTERRPVPPDVVAEWCDAINRRLRTGQTLRETLLREPADHSLLHTRTEPMRRSLDRGASVSDAISAAAAAAAPRDPHLHLLWSVLAGSAAFGGSAANPIDRVASTLRLRSADGHERAAQSAQAMMSAHVLTLLPVAVLVVLLTTDPDVRGVTRGGGGIAVVLAGLALNGAGWVWMKRTISGASAT